MPQPTSDEMEAVMKMLSGAGGMQDSSAGLTGGDAEIGNQLNAAIQMLNPTQKFRKRSLI